MLFAVDMDSSWLLRVEVGERGQRLLCTFFLDWVKESSAINI